MSYTTGFELRKRGINGKYTLEQALNRVYLGRATINLPKCLWGKKIKVILVEDVKE